LPPENILAEPAKRDTAAAVALATAWVAAHDHRATMMVLPADHVINDRAAFQKTMQTATRAAEETGALVTASSQPGPARIWLHRTGRARTLKGGPRPTTFSVLRFAKAEPELATASSEGYPPLERRDVCLSS
jgi:mannose-1-phosphate guanylyltransferase